MSLAQLRYFVTVAETGNVGRAARTLRVAQPAISRQIRNLEEELDAVLFFRSSRGMELSPAGRELLGRARSILSDVLAAESAVREAARRPKAGRPSADSRNGRPPRDAGGADDSE